MLQDVRSGIGKLWESPDGGCLYDAVAQYGRRVNPLLAPTYSTVQCRVRFTKKNYSETFILVQ